MPQRTLDDLEHIANKYETKIEFVIYSFLELGINIERINNEQTAQIIVREEGKKDKTLVLF